MWSKNEKKKFSAIFPGLRKKLKTNFKTFVGNEYLISLSIDFVTSSSVLPISSFPHTTNYVIAGPDTTQPNQTHQFTDHNFFIPTISLAACHANPSHFVFYLTNL